MEFIEFIKILKQTGEQKGIIVKTDNIDCKHWLGLYSENNELLSELHIEEKDLNNIQLSKVLASLISTADTYTSHLQANADLMLAKVIKTAIATNRVIETDERMQSVS